MHRQKKSVLKLVASLLILSLNFSCASDREPLKVGVGVLEVGKFYFTYPNGVTDERGLEFCEYGKCIFIKSDEFEDVLKRCKMKKR